MQPVEQNYLGLKPRWGNFPSRPACNREDMPLMSSLKNAAGFCHIDQAFTEMLCIDIQGPVYSAMILILGGPWAADSSAAFSAASSSATGSSLLA